MFSSVTSHKRKWRGRKLLPGIASWGCFQETSRDFPGGSVTKNLSASVRDLGSIPGLRRSPGEGSGNPLEYARLENPMGGGTMLKYGINS